MSISRRGFLKGVLGLAPAPAICKAENLMKIFVPSQELIIGRGMTPLFTTVDQMAFFSSDYASDGITQRQLVQRYPEHPRQKINRNGISGAFVYGRSFSYPNDSVLTAEINKKLIANIRTYDH